jgi:4-pyridoxolactonase
MRRIRALAEEHDAELLFSHDMGNWQGYRKGPDFYA